MRRAETKCIAQGNHLFEGRSHPNRYAMLLFKKSPDTQFIAMQLLARNETFHRLCDEYEACSEAIERLYSEHDGELRDQFNELRLRIEGELRDYISEHRNQFDRR